MRKIWLIVKREYLTRVRTKGFILSTVGLPLFSIGIFAFAVAWQPARPITRSRFPFWIISAASRRRSSQGLTKNCRMGSRASNWSAVWDRPATPTQVAHEELTRQVRDGQLDGFLEVPQDILNGKEATLHTRQCG